MNEIGEVEPGAIENAVAEAAPGLDGGLGWVIEGQSATYGPPEGAQLLAFACENGSLEVTRFAASTSGAGTLTFGAGEALASVAVAADNQAVENQRYEASLAPGDIGDDLVAVFADGTPINVTMTGVEPLIVAADAAVGSLITQCIGREQPPEAVAPADAAAATNITS